MKIYLDGNFGPFLRASAAYHSFLGITVVFFRWHLHIQYDMYNRAVQSSIKTQGRKSDLRNL